MHEQLVLIALQRHQIVGFCTLENNNYIDLFFVHKDYQRQGVASLLYEAITKQALHNKQSVLTANVSITAKPFFEKAGFKVLKVQQVEVRGSALTNFNMMKDLA